MTIKFNLTSPNLAMFNSSGEINKKRNLGGLNSNSNDINLQLTNFNPEQTVHLKVYDQLRRLHQPLKAILDSHFGEDFNKLGLRFDSETASVLLEGSSSSGTKSLPILRFLRNEPITIRTNLLNKDTAWVRPEAQSIGDEVLKVISEKLFRDSPKIKLNRLRFTPLPDKARRRIGSNLNLLHKALNNMPTSNAA